MRHEDSVVQLEKAEEELNIFPAFVKLILKIIRSDAYLPVQTIGVFPYCTLANTQSYLCFSKNEFDSFKKSMETLEDTMNMEVLLCFT